MSLDELSDGRAILGLGTSGPQVIEGWHGVPFDRPIRRMREVIDICRMVWRREPLRYDGECYTLPLPTPNGKPIHLLSRPRRERVPIFLASIGTRSVELAAELAEGWLSIFFLPESAEELWGSALAAGRARRPVDLPPLEIVAGGILAIGADVTRARDQARRQMALYVGGMGSRGTNFYSGVVRRYGFEAQAARIQELFLSGDKKAAEAAVPDELIDRIHLIGSAEHVRRRVEAYRSAGVTVLDIMPMGDDPLTDVGRVENGRSAASL